MTVEAIDPGVIAAICAIPRRFCHEEKSMRDLVAESGYYRVETILALELLHSHLNAEPSLIEDWERWSQDKRTSGGWYLTRSVGGLTVGSLDGRFEPTRFYASAMEACAEFIVRELKSVGAHVSDRERAD